MAVEPQQFKFVVIGASGGGKTSILRRLAEGQFVSGTQSTIGIEHFTHDTVVDGAAVRLLLWDTAGQERFYTIAKAYFRAALGVILVFDICDRKSFDELPRWLRDARVEADPHCAAVLVGNKIDQRDRRRVSHEEAAEFARVHGLSYFETSAKDGSNVQEVFAKATTEIAHAIARGDIVPAGAAARSPTVALSAVARKKRCCG